MELPSVLLTLWSIIMIKALIKIEEHDILDWWNIYPLYSLWIYFCLIYASKNRRILLTTIIAAVVVLSAAMLVTTTDGTLMLTPAFAQGKICQEAGTIQREIWLVLTWKEVEWHLLQRWHSRSHPSIQISLDCPYPSIHMHVDWGTRIKKATHKTDLN